MSKSPQQIAARIDKLTSFSDVALRISEVVADDNSTAEDIGALIETDPALSAALLRIANSAAYIRVDPVDNISMAVKVVGFNQVRDLAFAITATSAFDGIPNELISVEDFWKHSLYCAVASQLLANAAKMCRGTSLFTAGLLHDIGQLAMFSQEPELSRKALQHYLDQIEPESICHSERLVFGFDHTDVGSELALSWGFPEPLRAAIAYHHEPATGGEQADIAMIVNVANSLAVLAELDSTQFEDASSISEEALERINLDNEALLEIVAATRESTGELLQLFIG